MKFKLADASINIDRLEKERDFYFCKLREIEILTEKWRVEGKGAEVDAIHKVLYASDA